MTTQPTPNNGQEPSNNDRRRRRNRQADTATAQELAPLERYVLLLNSGKIYDQRDQSVYSRDVIELLLRAQGLSLKTLLQNNMTRVHGAMFNPTSMENLFEWNDGTSTKTYINTFRHENLPSPNADWATHPLTAAINEHLDFLLGADTTERNIMAWFIAHNIARPGVKIRWVPLLIGPQGDGKTTVLSLPAYALGDCTTTLDPAIDLEGSYTSWLKNSCYAQIEELLVPGHKFKIIEKLKPHISNTRVRLRDLYEPAADVLNVTNYSASSNHGDAIPMAESDRRWCLIFTQLWLNNQTDRKNADMLVARAPKFKALYQMLEAADAPGVLMGWAQAMSATAPTRS